MAYGLDIEEIYYTDANRVDQGVLDTYKISLDLAEEKNFSIESPYFLMQADNFWYVPDTEIGGIIDGYNTNSEDEKVTYEGRSFRGILHSHIIDKDLYLQGSIKDLCNQLISFCGLQGFAVCDDPDVEESVSTSVGSYTVVFGTTLYEALTGLSNSIDINLLYEYKAKDHKLHLIPVLAQDFTDYLMYSNVAGTYFEVEILDNVTNHLIVTGIEDETNVRRTIHLFTDEWGQFQPFSTKTVKLIDTGNEEHLCYEENGQLQPLEDHMYILDKRNQVLRGLGEIAEVFDGSPTVSQKYKKLFTCPSDWNTNFGKYFYLKKEIDEETGQVTGESWMNYEATENPPTYTLLSSKPTDWNTNYSAYFERTYNQETGQYDYNPVSANTELDYTKVHKQTTKPADWDYKYSEYYYYFQPGTSEQLTQYSGVSKTSFIKLKSKPQDWDANATSYYKKAYKEVNLKKLSKKKRKKLIKDCIKYGDAYYKPLELPKGKTKIKFVKNKYYRSDTYTVPPQFDSANTYHVQTKIVVPTFSNTIHYRQNPATYTIPKFVAGVTNVMIEDHYEALVLSGLEQIDELQKTSLQRMVLEDFEVNIGDTVGGKDEFTGTLIVKAVSNINMTIDSGLLTVEYEVKNQ